MEEMNSREKFCEVMQGGSPERVPLLEEGIRSEVLSEWRSQGGLGTGIELDHIYHFDKREEIYTELDLGINLVELSRRSDGLDKLQRKLDPTDPTLFPAGWRKKKDTWLGHGSILMLRVHRGFFLTMGVEEWDSFSEVMYLVKDNPNFVRQSLLMLGEFAANLADIVLQDVSVDAAIFSEPIGGNHGPLISPAMYRDYVLPSLKPLQEVLDRHNVETIIFRTYANTRILLPLFMEAGMNCLWAVERGSETMDYLDLRREFSSELRLIGGIDRDILRLGENAIRAELERVVPPLLDTGGYLPLVDGRIREDIPFENYAFYRELLEELTGYRIPQPVN